MDETEIIKRFELILMGVEIEDIDLIKLQIAKIKTFNRNKKINQIIECLETDDYANGIKYIEIFIESKASLTKYIDKELSILRLELKQLNIQLAEKEAQKIECQIFINKFHSDYTFALGDYLQEILKIKKELARNCLAQNPDDQLHKQEYEQAQQRYKFFNKEFKEIIDDKKNELSNDEKAELKRLYIESAKMCHPDAVNSNKMKAEEIFKKLSEARENNDLNSVREIYESLKRGDAFGIDSETIEDKALLKEKIVVLKEKISNIEKEIREIQEDDTYKLIIGIDNWDNYFVEVKKQLEKELSDLKKQYETKISLFQ
ncbi:MAG: hypothetical protein HQK65_17565 [Desulfamplus sp.]|nr:hypothetical protein [Desulfamplus sp.]